MITEDTQRLETYERRFQELSELLGDSELVKDQKRFVSLHKEYKEVSAIAAQISAWKKNRDACAANQKVLHEEKEQELLAMAKEEDEALHREKDAIERRLKVLLQSKDPNDEKNIVLEVRAGTGGDEAALWAGDLFRMYHRYAELQGWKLHIADCTPGPAGGYKEIIATVQGKNVYAVLKYESGVHRVQRVPATETQGRLHTSAASVVVLPEMAEVEVTLDMKDIRKETFCSSGPGGQSVNTTYSAVRLTHKPTGIVVSCQDGKSQIQNFDKALQILRARVNAQAKKAQQATISEERKSLVGSQDRSAKIRTYNYPRSAVTDHRINYTDHHLSHMLAGHMEGLLEALRAADQQLKAAAPSVQ